MKTGISMAMVLLVASFGCTSTKIKNVPKVAQSTSVQIEFQTLSVDSATFTSLPHDKLLQADELAQLKTAGKADMLSAQVISTIPESEAKIKTVKEWIYPTGVDYNTEEKQKTQIVGGVVAPSGFETREVGRILSTTASVSTNDYITLVLSYELVGEPSWEDFAPVLTGGGKKDEAVQTKMPIFPATSSSTTIIIHDGQRIIMGACPEPTDTKKTLVFIVGARILK